MIPRSPRLTRLARACTLVLLVASTACGTDNPSDPGTGTPSISITLGATTLVFQQGNDGTVVVTLSRAGGFSGAVDLALTGLPTGVTAPGAQIPAGSSQATLTLTAAVGAAVGSATATVRATGAGVAAATASLAVQVTAAPTGGFTLSLAPAALTIQQGATDQTTLGVARTSPFTGPVQVTATGPTGISVGGLAAAIAGTSAPLSVQVDGAVAPGTYTVTLTGSAGGVSDAAVGLDVTVTAAPSGVDYTWDFCDDVPVWMAVKDGSGAWTQVVGTGSQFAFTVTAATVAVAAVWDRAGEFETTIFYLSREEARLIEGACPVYKTVNGSVPGLAAGQFAGITLSRDATTLVGGTGTTFSLDRVEDGPTDFYASLTGVVGTVPVLLKMFLQRDINPAAGSSVTVDFAGPDAFDPTPIMVTANGLGADMAAPATSFVTPKMGASISSPGAGTAGPTWTVPVLPQDRVRAGDIQSVAVSAVSAASPLTDSRGTVKYFETVADQVLTVGPYLGTVTVTSEASVPYARPRVRYIRQADYMGHINVSFGQDTRDVIFWITDDYLGSATDLDVAFPDFGSVAGWNNLWGPLGGVDTRWVVNANGWTSGAGTIGPDVFTPGLEVRSAIRTGTITP